MKRTLPLLWVAMAACSSVENRPACTVSTDCAVGQYCAHTADGNVCWADGLAPAVSSVTVTCDGEPCRRDGTLHVVAEVSDDREVLDAAVSLDLALATPVPMARSEGSWVADVHLRDFPFDAFERDVVATVTARDGARNESGAVAGNAVSVTRLAWTYEAGVPMTSPAVMTDGTAVVGLSNNSEQLLAISPDGSKAWGLNVGGTAFVTAAPAIGERAIWVGSEDFSLYGVRLDGTGLLAGVGVNTEGAVRGSVAVLSKPAEEWGFAASASGRVSAASTTSQSGRSLSTNPYSTGPVVRATGEICAVTTTTVATLQCYAFDGGFNLDSQWTASVGSSVAAPLAVDGAGSVLSGSQDGRLNRTSPGTSETIATLTNSVLDSPVILSDGDVVVGDQSGLLHRYSPSGTPRWASEPSLGGAVLAPMVLSDGDAAFLVPTKTGTIHAVRSDGGVVWSTSLDSTELRAGNIHTPGDQPPGRILSNAYFSATNGKLYAVVVDGRLDASAPWPKAFHDPRNTNRAGPQP